MRTSIIISIGVAVALVALFLGHKGPLGAPRAAVWFSAVWAIAMIANLGVGISHGYSLAEELPILLLNVLPPTAVACIGAYLSRSRLG